MKSSFIYMCCQVGAEAALKAEVAQFAELRFAFSRPGFLTFKVEPCDSRCLYKLLNLCSRLIFARTVGISLGKVNHADPTEVAREIAVHFADIPHLNGKERVRVHVWERDANIPGEAGFEPGISPAARRLHAELVRQLQATQRLALGAEFPEIPAQPGEMLLDCAIVEPDVCWYGVHPVDFRSAVGEPKEREEHARWPGGVPPITPAQDAVSRAWLKFEEGLRWSGFPIGSGSRCLDIGASPGGASQALLARGAEVIGLDPGEIAPSVLAHPHFSHLRGRTGKVKLRHFRKVRWIVADMNVAPRYTLEALEDILRSRECQVRGLLFTLKLFNWGMAADIPEYLARIHDWGFSSIRAKQLAFNRQEITVAALRKRPK